VSTSHSLNKINHVAIIMDGNGRWAQKKKVTKKTGHEEGVKNCINICKNLKKLNYRLDELSFYVFSTENWERNPIEIKNLFSLINNFYDQFREIANENNLKIQHSGARKRLSKKLLNIIDDVTERTSSNTGTIINLMFNYGSREEINTAIKNLKSETKGVNALRKYLYLPNSKDPDLIIRTGGEQRLSNFMLWQSAYAELYFTKILWPDFKIKNLNAALNNYFIRIRKYGK